MLRYVIFKGVISILDFMKWHVGKGVKLVTAVSETYPFTDKAFIL